MIDFKKLRSNKGFVFLQSNFSTFLKKLIRDKYLSQKDKLNFFDYLAGFNGKDRDDFEQYCKVFFWSNKQLGHPLLKPYKLNPFFRIVISESLFGRIRQLIGLEYIKIRPLIMEMSFASDQLYQNALLANLLNNLVLPKNYKDEDNCLRYFGIKEWSSKRPPRLGDAKIESYLQWSFIKPIGEDIFDNQRKINQLDCRAGLIDKVSDSKKNKILFVHNVDVSLKPSIPTCFDAEFYPQFEPGGKTQPLKKCEKEKGFTEYIHTSNTFRELTGVFYEIYKN